MKSFLAFARNLQNLNANWFCIFVQRKIPSRCRKEGQACLLKGEELPAFGQEVFRRPSNLLENKKLGQTKICLGQYER